MSRKELLGLPSRHSAMQRVFNDHLSGQSQPGVGVVDYPERCPLAGEILETGENLLRIQAITCLISRYHLNTIIKALWNERTPQERRQVYGTWVDHFESVNRMEAADIVLLTMKWPYYVEHGLTSLAIQAAGRPVKRANRSSSSAREIFLPACSSMMPSCLKPPDTVPRLVSATIPVSRLSSPITGSFTAGTAGSPGRKQNDRWSVSAAWQEECQHVIWPGNY